MKYIIMKYLRISSEDIDLDGLDKYESNSITHQRLLLNNFTSKMLAEGIPPGFDEYEVLESLDDGRTGTNFNRPGVQKVLDLAQRGKVHCVIVKDLSRFGRNYLEVGDYLEQIFPVWGVRFISVNDMYDSANYHGTTGGIDIAFRNLIAEMYSQDLSEKVRSAKTNINMNGKTCASYSFYGYSKDSNNRHKLVIDEPAAEIVRLIFNLYEQGMTAAKIAKKLNNDGIQTASARQREKGAKRDWLRKSKVNMWDSSYITRVLHDERYTGKHIYGKMKRIELGKLDVKAVPRSEWIIVPDAFPAIITQEQFTKVQEMMKNKSSKKVNKSIGEKLLFYRKISCGNCGRALVRSPSGGGHIYYCTTRNRIDEFGCMRGSIHEDELVETVLTVIRQQAQLAENIKQADFNNKSVPATMDNLHSEIQHLKRLIDKANSAKLSIWEKQHSGNMSPEAYQAESGRLTNQIIEYADMIVGFENKIHDLETESGQENVFVERFSRQTSIKKLTREVVDEFIKTIRVYAPDRVEVILNYADEYKNIEEAIGAVC